MMLCSKALKARYCLKTLYGMRNSWFWKGLATALNFIKSYISWIVGKGDNITFWECNWIPSNEGLRKPISNVVFPDLNVKDLWKDIKTWDEVKICRVFDNQVNVDNIP